LSITAHTHVVYVLFFQCERGSVSQRFLPRIVTRLFPFVRTGDRSLMRSSAGATHRCACSPSLCIDRAPAEQRYQSFISGLLVGTSRKASSLNVAPCRRTKSETPPSHVCCISPGSHTRYLEHWEHIPPLKIVDFV
jgi:hypothetical protein